MAKMNPLAVAAAVVAGGAGLMLLARKGASAPPARQATPSTSTPKKKRRTDLPKVPMDLAAAKREAPRVAADVRARQYDYDRPLMATFQGHSGLDGDGVYGPKSRAALQYFGVSDPPKALFKGATTTYLPPAGAIEAKPQAFGPPAPPQNSVASFFQGSSQKTGSASTWQGGGGSFSGAGASGSWDQESAKRAAQIVAQGGGSPDDAPAQETGDEPVVSSATPSNLELARREAPLLAKHIASKKQNYSRQAAKDFQAHAGLVPDGFYGPVTRSALQYFGVANPPPAIAKGKPGGVTTYAPPG